MACRHVGHVRLAEFNSGDFFIWFLFSSFWRGVHKSLLDGFWVILLLLIHDWKLIGHGHAIQTIYVKFQTFHRVLKRWFLYLLLFCQFWFEFLLTFNQSLLFDFGLRFLIQVTLHRIICNKLLIGLWQLPAIIHYCLDLVQILSEIFWCVFCVSPSAGLIYQQFQSFIGNDYFPVVLIVLLPKDGIHLWRF